MGVVGAVGSFGFELALQLGDLVVVDECGPARQRCLLPPCLEGVVGVEFFFVGNYIPCYPTARAQATILERFISTELQPWTETFPPQFYQEICRLKQWPSVRAVKRRQ